MYEVWADAFSVGISQTLGDDVLIQLASTSYFLYSIQCSVPLLDVFGRPEFFCGCRI